MGGFFHSVTTGALGGVPLRQVALAMLCAYLMGHALSALYVWMRRGQDYSRSFAQALVLGGIVGAMIMLAIGNSLARGVGIFGALSLIRFRTNLRDPIDMIFIFASFASGIAAGAGNIAAGLVGSGIFAVVIVATRATAASRGQIEAELRVRLNNETPLSEDAVVAALKEHVVGFALVKRRVIAPGKEKAELRLEWRITLRDLDDEARLMQALQGVAGLIEAAVAMDSGGAAAPGSGDDD
jgi:uncharacterized membrane protein YhiD involved in acid resistance